MRHHGALNNLMHDSPRARDGLSHVRREMGLGGTYVFFLMPHWPRHTDTAVLTAARRYTRARK